MLSYPVPENEQQRLQALYDYAILDTLSEKEYDCITKIAAQICGVPASLITFLDKDRQWFKSHLGIDIKETPREISFCNYTIMDPDNVMVVPDLRADERYQANPLVTDAPNAVFYAGAPLVTPDGFVLGSICVLDAKVNNLSTEQREALKGLAYQVIAQLELQKKIKELHLSQNHLERANKKLQNFAHIVSHDMKTPLANILLMSRSLKNNYKQQMDEKALPYFELIDRSTNELLVFIDDILIQSETITNEGLVATPVDSKDVLNKVIDLVAAPADMKIKLKGKFPKVNMNKTSLQQVFQNLITNAIKYNDKKKGEISISSISDNNFHYFNFADNGIGIAKADLPKIFADRKTLNKTDRYGNKGTGIGLAAVKDILETCGGKITVTSKENIGSTFKIYIPSSDTATAFRH
jgi:signal transduction histidine kinase